jgi:hypothetical protein
VVIPQPQMVILQPHMVILQPQTVIPPSQMVILQNVLYDARTNVVPTRKNDVTCISQYMSSLCMGLDKRVKSICTLVKYSKRLLQAINDVEIKDFVPFQSHNPDNHNTTYHHNNDTLPQRNTIATTIS